jgi:hypothetical protein
MSGKQRLVNKYVALKKGSPVGLKGVSVSSLDVRCRTVVTRGSVSSEFNFVEPDPRLL